MSEKNIPESMFSRDIDGDNWHEDIEGALDDMDFNGEDHVTLYMGTVGGHTHGGLLNVMSDVIENMQERAYEAGSDYAEGYLEDIPKEKLADLHSVIVAWLDTNAEQPIFYTIVNPVEIKVQLDADGNYVSHREAACQKN